jgi:hypothetical protein
MHDLGASVLTDFASNAQRSPSRPRFSHDMRVFSDLNLAFSSADFRFQRMMLPLPSKQSLDSTFGPGVQKIESLLTSREMIPRLIQN